ncbi:Imm50 family immunity protein [Pantoea deleyi]|uniref:Imm50 family immunity protein n=1 Tax=Pantoea deleyi TaxID=470932 RepID=UPI0035D4709F
MWFEYALHKEKITHIFGGVFELKDAQLNGFYFHETSSIRFLFSIKGIPQQHPKKWIGNGYNAMNIVLGFDGIKKFNANCCTVNFICNPAIHSSQGKSTISIESEVGSVFCESEFLIIENISPYTDIRWD